MPHLCRFKATWRAIVLLTSVSVGCAAPPETTPEARSDGGDLDTVIMCLDTEHDGGDGECVPSGECSPGFTLEATGTCAGVRSGVSMPARALHTATLMADGRVLVVGGWNQASGTYFGADIYDADADVWTSAARPITGRWGHQAVGLDDGRVLIVGGRKTTEQWASQAEVWDPATGAWREVGPDTGNRRGHVALRLLDGRVMVAAGRGSNDAVFAPVTDSWTAIPSPPSLHYGASLSSLERRSRHRDRWL